MDVKVFSVSEFALLGKRRDDYGPERIQAAEL
jgi:hypothetical protein